MHYRQKLIRKVLRVIRQEVSQTRTLDRNLIKFEAQKERSLLSKFINTLKRQIELNHHQERNDLISV